MRIWLTAALLAIAGCLNYADRTAISAVFPLLRSDLGMSDAELAAIGTAFLWTYSAASPLAGMAADRWARHRLVAISLMAWSLATLWGAAARDKDELILTRVALGLSECLYLPAAVGLIADLHGLQTRGRALGLHSMGIFLGSVVGGGLAGLLADHFGWRAGLTVLGAAGVVWAIVLWFIVLPAKRIENQEHEPLSHRLGILFRLKTFYLFAAQAMLVSVGTWMFFNWMPLYLKERFSLSLAAAGFSGTATLQVAASVGLIVGAVISDRMAKRHASIRFLLMSVFFLCSAPFLLVFASDAGLYVVTAGMIAFSLFRGLGMANETPSLCDLLPSNVRSTGQGLMNMLNTFAGGIGVYIAGRLKQDWGLGGVFSGVSVVMVLAAALAYAAFLRQRRS
ncbi:MAG: MFS transporter [Candidatus Solibacter usitatus]|nr:MFS transporter [Candidatus Solibacter usitatus]